MKRRQKRKKRRKKKGGNCRNCGKYDFFIQKHHITYIPCKTIKICSDCHREITKRNTLIAYALIGRKLTNEERILIWNDFFMRGNMLNKNLMNILEEIKPKGLKLHKYL